MRRLIGSTVALAAALCAALHVLAWLDVQVLPDIRWVFLEIPVLLLGHIASAIALRPYFTFTRNLPVNQLRGLVSERLYRSIYVAGSVSIGLFLVAMANPKGVLRGQNEIVAAFSAIAFAMLYTYSTVLLGMRPPTKPGKGT